MSEPAAALAAALLGVAVLAWWRPPRRLRVAPVPRDAGPVEDHGFLQRWRWLLAGLVALGGWAMLGGWFGLVAGGAAGWVAARALLSVEGPRARERRVQLQRDLPTGVDLVAASLRAGGAVDSALVMVADALPGPLADEFRRLHHRLALGDDPTSVWADLARHDELGPMGRSLGRAHETGAPVLSTITALAAELRDRRRFEVEARARAIDVKASAPLGVCLLPAFVLIGIVPMVAGLLGATGLF